MSVTISAPELKRIHDLFVLLHEKKGFELAEYEDVGRIFKHVVSALEKAKDSDGELERLDVQYILNTINVCSVRVGMGVQNYRLIADLLDSLTAAMKDVSDDEETKDESS